MKRDVTLLAFLISIWSFSEIFVRNALLSYVHHSAVLTGIAAAVIFSAYLLFRDNKNLPFYFAGLTSGVLFVKWLVVPLGGVHYSCIVNSSLAIFLDGLIFSVALLVFRPAKIFSSSLVLSLASLVVALVFRLAGISLFPCNYLLSFAGTEGVFRFVLYEGGTWFVAVTVLIVAVSFIRTFRYNSLKMSLVGWLSLLIFIVDIIGTVAGYY